MDLPLTLTSDEKGSGGESKGGPMHLLRRSVTRNLRLQRALIERWLGLLFLP